MRGVYMDVSGQIKERRCLYRSVPYGRYYLSGLLIHPNSEIHFINSFIWLLGNLKCK